MSVFTNEELDYLQQQKLVRRLARRINDVGQSSRKVSANGYVSFESHVIV
jgi:hypothetical protein